MDIKNIYGFSFSPTGGTYKITKNILEGMNSNNLLDITSTIDRQEFNPNDIIVFSVPVFGGRVPDTALKRINSLTSKDTLAVAVVVYGNREYDDALLELTNALEENNFKLIAGAAFIARHSIARSVAENRPDENDSETARNFGRNIIKKVNTLDKFEPIKVPGNIPYREYNGLPLKPKANKSCIKCSLCADRCPMDAIDKDNPRLTDKDKCITCMLCINICPTNSRKLNPILQMITNSKLLKSCSVEKLPEIFL